MVGRVRLLMAAICLAGLSGDLFADDAETIRRLQAENKLLQAQVASLQKQLAAAQSGDIEDSDVDRPQTKVAKATTKPAVKQWDRLINCTLKFPTGSAAAAQTEAYWQQAVASIKEAGELVGQMKVSSVRMEDGKAVITAAQIETGRVDVITCHGAIYLITLKTELQSAPLLKCGEMVMFYGQVEAATFTPVRNHRLNDTQLLDGYALGITVTDPIIRIGYATQNLDEQKNPKAWGARARWKVLSRTCQALQKKQSNPERMKKLEATWEEMAELRTRSQINELKWWMLRDHKEDEK